MSIAFILFGNGKSAICNINCRNVALLKTLKETCHEVCEEEDQLDLADEYGECKHLLRNLQGYASDFIAPRERVILLRAEQSIPRNGDPLSSTFLPLLKSARDDKIFMSNLNQPSQKAGRKKHTGHKLVTSADNGPGISDNGSVQGSTSKTSNQAEIGSSTASSHRGGRTSNNQTPQVPKLNSRRNSRID